MAAMEKVWKRRESPDLQATGSWADADAPRREVEAITTKKRFMLELP
jgi:hypothetical protein